MQSTLPLERGTHALGAPGHETDLRQTLAGKLILAVGASALVAVCAHVSLPLYFTPVPLTLQTFAVLLVGLTLGPTLGFSAMILYLAEGAAGLPVFSPHGPGGIAQLLGPTAGFLFSYPLAAAAAGYLVRAVQITRSRFTEAILATALASIVIFAMGAGWLAHLLHLNFAAAGHMGVYPFLPGEAIKITAASALYTSLRRWQRL